MRNSKFVYKNNNDQFLIALLNEILWKPKKKKYLFVYFLPYAVHWFEHKRFSLASGEQVTFFLHFIPFSSYALYFGLIFY